MNSTEALREFADRWGKEWDEKEGWVKSKALTNMIYDELTALISENYVEKAKYDEAVRQRDELREALIDMVWQFAYVGTKDDKAVVYTGGLSALEGAFSALGLSDPITILDFEAAIKNTDC